MGSILHRKSPGPPILHPTWFSRTQLTSSSLSSSSTTSAALWCSQTTSLIWSTSAPSALAETAGEPLWINQVSIMKKTCSHNKTPCSGLNSCQKTLCQYWLNFYHHKSTLALFNRTCHYLFVIFYDMYILCSLNVIFTSFYKTNNICVKVLR